MIVFQLSACASDQSKNPHCSIRRGCNLNLKHKNCQWLEENKEGVKKGLLVKTIVRKVYEMQDVQPGGKNRYGFLCFFVEVLFFGSCGRTGTVRILDPSSLVPCSGMFLPGFITCVFFYYLTNYALAASILYSWATRSCSMHIIIKYISGLCNSEQAVYSNANLDAYLTGSEKNLKDPLGSPMQACTWMTWWFVLTSLNIFVLKRLG